MSRGQPRPDDDVLTGVRNPQPSPLSCNSRAVTPIDGADLAAPMLFSANTDIIHRVRTADRLYRLKQGG
jgi:hypothetical protein